MRAAIAAIALSWLIPHIAAAEDTAATSKCQLKRYASIDLRLSHGLAYVPVAINTRHAWMVLVLQSVFTSLWDSRASEWATSIGRLPGHGGQWRVASLDDFQIGSLSLGKAKMIIGGELAASQPMLDGIPVVGGLGTDVFARSDFELDFASHKLNLYSTDHCQDSVVYWADSYAAVPIHRGALGNYFFPMELDGKKIETELSTTMDAARLQTDVTRKLYGFDEHSRGIEHESDASGHAIAHYRAMSVSTNGLKVANARIREWEEPPKKALCTVLGTYRGDENAAMYTNCRGGEPPLLLGMNVVQQLHLYFATKEQMLYFTAADATTSPTSPTSSATGSVAPDRK